MTSYPSFDLSTRVALVTGASKGIGAAIARALAHAGAKVMVSSRKQEAVEQVAAQIQGAGGEAAAHAANMGDSTAIEELVEACVLAFGGVDIVVNNAAINPVFGSILATEEAAFDKIMQVNLKGPFHLAKCCYPILKQRGGGCILNIASTAGLKPWQGIGVYSVSKAALIQLTKGLANELGPDGVRVHAICPGLIKTKLSEALWKDEKTNRYIHANTPLRRIGEPEDLGGLAVFLASDAARHMTGGIHVVDGGML